MDLGKTFAAGMITLSTVTSASASTGGNHTSGTVVTGSQSSSVQVENTISANDEGGTSITHIETSDNGVTSSTTLRHDIPAGDSFTEVIATSTPYRQVSVTSHGALYITPAPSKPKALIRPWRNTRGFHIATGSIATSSNAFIKKLGASSGAVSWNIETFFSQIWPWR